MASTSDHYLACAAQSLRDADASTLDNVRERCLRSAAAWEAMADRALKIETERRQRADATLAAADAIQDAAHG